MGSQKQAINVTRSAAPVKNAPVKAPVAPDVQAVRDASTKLRSLQAMLASNPAILSDALASIVAKAHADAQAASDDYDVAYHGATLVVLTSAQETLATWRKSSAKTRGDMPSLAPTPVKRAKSASGGGTSSARASAIAALEADASKEYATIEQAIQAGRDNGKRWSKSHVQLANYPDVLRAMRDAQETARASGATADIMAYHYGVLQALASAARRTDARIRVAGRASGVAQETAITGTLDAVLAAHGTAQLALPRTPTTGAPYTLYLTVDAPTSHNNAGATYLYCGLVRSASGAFRINDRQRQAMTLASLSKGLAKRYFGGNDVERANAMQDALATLARTTNWTVFPDVVAPPAKPAKVAKPAPVGTSAKSGAPVAPVGKFTPAPTANPSNRASIVAELQFCGDSYRVAELTAMLRKYDRLHGAPAN